jgi:hypothetical protein
MRTKLKFSLVVLLVGIFFLGFVVGAQDKRTARGAENKEIYEYLKTFSDVLRSSRSSTWIRRRIRSWFMPP